jgi:hypothetical protein
MTVQELFDFSKLKWWIILHHFFLF